MALEIRLPQLTFTGSSTKKSWVQVQVTPTPNSLLGFNASSVPANVTIGSGLALAGNVLSATNSGSVTSVGLSMPTGFSVANSPVTSTGTLAVSTTLNGILYGDGANTIAAVTIGSGLSFAAGTLSATGAGGTVTSVSVVTANGVSGSVATATTTPAITLTLGAITPTTVNGLTISTTTGTLTITNGKIFSVSNTLTLAGTDGSTLNVGAGGTLGTAAFTAASAYEVPLTFSTGLTRSVNTITVNTSQNIATLSNLTSNGVVTTSGGVGTLSVTATTGSGSVVLATSPTLVTPALGTPSAIVLTNATGLPIGGLAGLGTGVATALGNTTNASGGIVTFSGNIGAATGTSLTTSGDITSSAGSLNGTGSILSSATQPVALDLRRPVGSTGSIYFRTGSSARWQWAVTGTNETGANAGSNWTMERFSDAGASLGTSLLIIRSSGLITLANIVTIDTTGNIGGVVDLTMSGTLTVDTVNATTFNFTTFGTGVVPGANGGTGVANSGKTITLGASLTTTGTDLPTFAFPSAATARTYTFPTTTATLARTDAAQTFTGTQTIGALVVTTVNGNTFTTGTGVLTIAASKTLTASNTLTLAGTDSTTITFQGTDTYVGRTTTDTLTNKRVTARITPITSSATPTVNTDNCDCVTITALAAAITSMTTNLSGTPNNFDQLEFRILDDGTARAITWGASFAAGPTALPTTTVLGKALCVYFEWDSVQAKWMCMSSGSYA